MGNENPLQTGQNATQNLPAGKDAIVLIGEARHKQEQRVVSG